MGLRPSEACIADLATLIHTHDGGSRDDDTPEQAVFVGAWLR